MLLGASGAGKSTVVNALAGRDLMATGDDPRGRRQGPAHHDPPRARRPAVGRCRHRHPRPARGRAGRREDGLAQAFSDIEELAAACRFADCAHVGEPGCAVQASIEAGDLSAARIDSWRHLQRELAYQARRTDARLRAAEKAKWKAVHRAQRARGGRP